MDPKVRQNIRLDINSSAIPPIGDINWLNSQSRSRLLLKVVWRTCNPINILC